MSQSVVVDASVALKLVLKEESSDRVEALVAASLGNQVPVYGPPHLFSEVVNALHQRCRRQHMTPEEAKEAFARFRVFAIQQIEPDGLYEQALDFAQAHQIKSIYDCLYVVAAQLLGAELWTADRNLINALGNAAPWVRWIGDYPLPQSDHDQ